MGDISITWDVNRGVGDWTITNGALDTGNDLVTAMYVSLFTDKRASPDFVCTDGTNDRRGCWLDTYAEEEDGEDDGAIGSLLWQLERAKKTVSLLSTAQEMCADALQWLITDGIVDHFDIVAEWQNGIRLALSITAYEPDGTTTPFNASWAWNSIPTE